MLNLRKPAPEMTGSGFQEGNVRVEEAVIMNHHPNVPEGQEDRGTHVALRLKVTRLDEDLEPVVNPETEEPVTEDLYFSFGGKSLGVMHPATASSPEAIGDAEDEGDQDNAEGNTIKLLKDDYQINSKAGIYVLWASLDAGLKSKDEKTTYFSGSGMKPVYLERVWAPDFVGCIFHMKTFLHPEVTMAGRDGKPRPVAYKIVDKVIKGPGESAGKKSKNKSTSTSTAPAAEKKAASNGNSAPSGEAGKVLDQILREFADNNDGKFTRKAFWRGLNELLTRKGVSGEMQLEVMGMYKDEGWMASNLPKYDMQYADGEVTVQ